MSPPFTPTRAAQASSEWKAADHDWDRAVRELVHEVQDLDPAEMTRALMLHQRTSWEAGERIPAEVYVDAIAGADETAIMLIYSEFLLREKLGEAPALEEYQRRFPRLARYVQRQVETHRALGLNKTRDDDPAMQFELAGPSESWPSLPGYQIHEEIGRGGMGIVYKAYQCSLQRVVALKVINGQRLARPDFVVRFQREAMAAAQLAHANIVAIYDAGQVGDLHYYAMEYLEGCDLEALVEQTGALSVATACDYIRQAALGLHHAFERGLVHRDVKPANLVVARAAAGLIVKILDLGLARTQLTPEEGSGRLTCAGDMVGTPYYMAPEQILDPRNADIRADLYSLGCTFYYLLTGKTPFMARSVVEVLDMHRWLNPRPLNKLREDVPAPLAEIVMRLMAKRREDRYQTPRELVEALEKLHFENTPSPANTPAPIDHPPAAPMTRRTPANPPAPLGAGTVAVPGQPVSSLASPVHTLKAEDVKARLADLLDKNELRRARPLVDDLLRLNPRDSDALAALDFIRASRNEKSGSGELFVLKGHQQAVTSVAFSPDGGRAVSGSLDQTWRLWDTKRGKELGCIQGHDGPVNSLAVSGDGRYVLTGSDDMSLRLWELNQDKALGDLVPANIIQQQGQLWDVSTARELRRFKGWQGGVNCVGFSADGRYAISGSKGGHVQLWKVSTGKLSRDLKGHKGEIYRVGFSPECDRVLSCGRDSTVRVWSVLDGRPVWSLNKSPHLVLSAVFSADGERVVLGCSDHKVYLIDLTSGQEVWQFAGHKDKVTTLALCTQTPRLLTGSSDHTLRLVDMTSGRPITQLAGHTAEITSVAFSPDGGFALSGSKDKTVRMWKLPS